MSRPLTRRLLVLPVLALLLSAGPARARDILSELAAFLHDAPTATLNMITTGTAPEKIDQALLTIYQDHGMAPLWLSADTGQPVQRAVELLKVLRESAADGMNPDDYRTGAILTLWIDHHPAARARLDVLLTLALARYVADMREGSADPCLLDPRLFASARDRRVDLMAVVKEALAADNLKKFLAGQAPAHRAYQGLRAALARYRKIFAQGGFPVIPPGNLIKPGDRDDRLIKVARRLALTGEYTGPLPAAPVYTPELVAAVKRFQAHFQLEPDGVIGPATLAALNTPVRELIRRIILNMERWRWLPHRLDGQRIFVNIAGFELYGARDEQVELQMPVIVGRVYHKTPVFTGRMKYIVVNPYWNLPNSIALKEVVPKMQKDPGYLKRERIRIFAGWDENAPEVDPAAIDWHTIGRGITRYRLRQDPGPDNALGRIKFMLPNRYNVYLHDTPARELFKRTRRSFSHGCIRLGRPLDLAVYLLRHSRHPLDRGQIQQMIDQGRRKVILLDNPVPVHIIYRTVLALETGEVFFYPDLYGRDRLLARALFARKPLSQCRLPVPSSDR